MWKAWFILAWLSILTGKLLYLSILIVNAYHCDKTLSLNIDKINYCKHKNVAQIVVLSIMIIIIIITGLWIITTFPDT